MAHKTIRGTIRYTSKKPERFDQERGREFFTITTQADKNVVMLAHCEIDDAPNVIRDVVVAMDPNGKQFGEARLLQCMTPCPDDPFARNRFSRFGSRPRMAWRSGDSS